MASKTTGNIEKQVVSLAGTLLHLTKIQNVINNKPLIPRHMEALMGSVSSEMDGLTQAFDRVSSETGRIAGPVLNEWLAASLSKSVGDPFKSVMTMRSGAVVELFGRVHSIELHNSAVDAWRAVRVILHPAEICVDGQRVQTVGAAFMSVRDYDLHKYFSDQPVKDGGRDENAIRMLVPIQEKVRAALSRPSRYSSSVLF